MCEDPRWSYLFVRKDLSQASQIVQAAHAAQFAAVRWGVPTRGNLVLLAVDDEPGLFAIRDYCTARCVPSLLFIEPDFVDEGTQGATALCTAPLPREARSLFRRFALWEE